MLKTMDILRSDSDPQAQQIVALLDRAHNLQGRLSSLVPTNFNANCASLVQFIETGCDRSRVTAVAEKQTMDKLRTQLVNAVAFDIASALRDTMSSLRRTIEQLYVEVRAKPGSFALGLGSSQDQAQASVRLLAVTVELADRQFFVDEALTRYRESCSDHGRDAIIDAYLWLQNKVRATTDGAGISTFLSSADQAPDWAQSAALLVRDGDALIAKPLSESAARTLDSYPKLVTPEYVEASRNLRTAQILLSSILYAGSPYNVKEHVKSVSRKLPKLVLEKNYGAVDDERLMLEHYVLQTRHGLRQLELARRAVELAITGLTTALQGALMETLPENEKISFERATNMLIDYAYLMHLHRLLASSEEPFVPFGALQTVNEVLQATANAFLKEGYRPRFPLAWPHREEQRLKRSGVQRKR